MSFVVSGSNVIPFVGQVDAEELTEWMSALSSLMPGERLVPFSDLTDEEKLSAEIAIVANPHPDEIAKLPNLIWIHSVWAGVERMVAEFKDSSFDIVRLIDPELSRTMAEAVLSWSLYLHRDMPAYLHQQKNREWKARPYKKASQKTVGILGLGSLGATAANTLFEAGFKVAGWSRSNKELSGIQTYAGPKGLKTIFSKSDILVCLLPLTGETRGLINRDLLTLMPDRAGIINFGRGPIINKIDFLGALETGVLSHAVLDVFETEPLPEDDAFWDQPNVTVLPHISAPTDIQTASEIVAGNINNFRATGELPQIVNRGRGY